MAALPCKYGTELRERDERDYIKCVDRDDKDVQLLKGFNYVA